MNPGRRDRLFFYPKYPDRLWGPPSRPVNGYRNFFCRGKGPCSEVEPSSLYAFTGWTDKFLPIFSRLVQNFATDCCLLSRSLSPLLVDVLQSRSGQTGGTCICFKKEGEKNDHQQNRMTRTADIMATGEILLLKQTSIKPYAFGGEF